MVKLDNTKENTKISKMLYYITLCYTVIQKSFVFAKNSIGSNSGRSQPTLIIDQFFFTMKSIYTQIRINQRNFALQPPPNNGKYHDRWKTSQISPAGGPTGTRPTMRVPRVATKKKLIFYRKTELH